MYNSPFTPGFYPAYTNPFQNTAPQQPVQQVIRVNGENGARAFQIGANSSTLLLDESGLIVWLVTTDGAGYKTVSPYDITPHKEAPAPDYVSLEQRIGKLEAFVNEFTADSSAVGKSETATGKPGPD